MTWSISKGTEVAAWGRRQYSHRPAARSRTICGRLAAMPLVDRLVRLQRSAGLRVHQVEQEADAAVIFHFRLLLGRKPAVLVFNGQLVHTVEFMAVETNRQQRFGGFDSKVAIVRADQAA